MNKTKRQQIVDCIELLGDVIRENPHVPKSYQALDGLNQVANFMRGIDPVFAGLDAGQFDEWSHEATDEEGNRVTVDPAADRVAANAAIRDSE